MFGHVVDGEFGGFNSCFDSRSFCILSELGRGYQKLQTYLTRALLDLKLREGMGNKLTRLDLRLLVPAIGGIHWRKGRFLNSSSNSSVENWLRRLEGG
jgi:hypothetical protein